MNTLTHKYNIYAHYTNSRPVQESNPDLGSLTTGLTNTQTYFIHCTMNKCMVMLSMTSITTYKIMVCTKWLNLGKSNYVTTRNCNIM